MNRIKDILKEKDITQQELANRLGVTRMSIVKTLAGNPSQETLERIAKALGVEVWELFTPSTSSSDFMALVKAGNSYYHATSLSELKEIVRSIEKE